MLRRSIETNCSFIYDKFIEKSWAKAGTAQILRSLLHIDAKVISNSEGAHAKHETTYHHIFEPDATYATAETGPWSPLAEPFENHEGRGWGISGKKRGLRGGGRTSDRRRKGRRKALSRRHRSRTYNGGHFPLYKRFPKWKGAIRQWRKESFDWCSLRKVLQFLKKGRLDSRFPITQRHLNDSGLVRVKRGVKLYNTDDLPFPYRIDIEVTAADQSSIDAIRHVGGTVTIVYRSALNLRCHLRPHLFPILPATARPDLNAIYALEKYRARGCLVHYIKPLWLLQEEAIVQSELATLDAERRIKKHIDCGSSKTYADSSNTNLRSKLDLLMRYRTRMTQMAREKKPPA